MTTQRKSASAYLFRNFLSIVPIVIVPALLFAYCASNGIHFDVILDLVFAPSQSTTPVLDLANEVIAAFGQTWWILLLAAVTFLYATSFVIAKVERHMRYGLLSNKRLAGRAVLFMPRLVSFFALITIGALLLYGFVVGAIYFCNKIVSGAWFVVIVVALIILLIVVSKLSVFSSTSLVFCSIV